MATLYRGQPTAAARAAAAARMTPWLQQALHDLAENPMLRARGRWFTDDPDIARWYAGDATGDAEIVCIDLPDEEAERYRVATTPVTPCGLEPGRFSRDPEREFLVPAHIAEQAVPWQQI